MKIKQITETTTAGAIATVNSPLGGTQSRGNPSIYGGKKVGTLFKGKKTKAPYANSINESAELSEAHLEEDDVIVVPGQGRSRKNGFVPHGQSRVDHEVEMARSDLFSAAKNAQQVFSMIKDVSEDEGLDGWVQEKIIKANDYLNTIREYLEGKQVQGVTENNQRVDSLVTDSLKIMRGPEVNDAVSALKTVLGNREYNSRRGYYSFYVRQLMDMHGQEGLTEGLHPMIIDDVKKLATLSPTDRYSAYSNIRGYFKADPALSKMASDLMGGYYEADMLRGKYKTAEAKAKYAELEPMHQAFIKQSLGQEQGVTEGSRNAYLKHNNLVDLEKPLAGLKDEFNKFLRTHDPEEKQKFQQGIKQRIKTRPMAGPKGVLPEQDVAEADMNRRGFLKGIGAAMAGAAGIGAASNSQARASAQWLEKVEQAKELLAKGFTPDQIAKKLGVTGPNNGMAGPMNGDWGAINYAVQQVRQVRRTGMQEGSKSSNKNKKA